MPKHRPVLVNLPVGLLEQLTDAAKALAITRSQLIRRALQRDITFVTSYELARLNQAKKDMATDYRRWLKRTFKEASVVP